MAKEILVGTNKVKKIFVGTTPVKKVYVGTTLCWSANETGNWHVSSPTTAWGGKFYTQVKVYVKEKDYAENRMLVSVEVVLGSSGYYISSSTTKTGNLYIDGSKRSDFTYNATIAINATKTLTTQEHWVTAASGKRIAIRTVLPMGISHSLAGTIGTQDDTFYVTLPTL